MKYIKRILIFTVVMLMLVSIASVCAGDVNDTAIASDNTNHVIEEINEDSISSSEKADILNAKDDGEFSTLQNKIDNVALGSTIYFENNYTCDNGFDSEEIKIIAIDAVSDENINIISDASSDEVLQLTGEEAIAQTRTPTGNTFKDIQNTIWSSDDGDIIELSGTYTGSGNVISVVRAVTFSGKNDATLDAKGLSGIMEFETGDIILKNIRFINSEDTAIDGNMKSFEIRNCEFRNCHGVYSGAINGYDSLVADSTFVNCTSSGNGAIFGGKIENCTFIACNAHDSCRGVVAGDYVVNSTFIDCYADSFACIIEKYTPCESCMFINCSSDFTLIEKAKNSIFMSCSGTFSGAVENCTILSYIDDLSKYDVKKYYNGIKYPSTFIVNGNTFEDIRKAVNGASEGDIIQLYGTYTGNEEIIIYSSNLIIEGNGATLNSKSSIFYCKLGITIKNLVFTNTQDNAVRFEEEGIIINSTFKNCYGFSGGAISGHLNKNCRAVNCTFEECSGSEGGAVYALDLIANSTFINCQASEGGGAYECELISNCTFVGCNAYTGGAVYSEFGRTVEKSTFKDCKAKYGAAIANCDVSDSSFTNCISTTQDGGAVTYKDEYSSVTRCMFTDCECAVKGGKTYYCIFRGTSKPDPSKTILYRHAALTLTQTGTYYHDKILTVKLTDTDSNVEIPNQNIKITFSNGGSITIKTNSNGIGTYGMPYAPGNYRAVAAVSENDKIDCSQKTLENIAIEKAPSKVTVKKLTTPYKANNKLNVKLTNTKTKKAVSDIELTLKVFTGKKFKTYSLTTDENGGVNLQTSGLAIGQHKVVIESRDKGVSLESQTTYIVVQKPSVKISSSNTLFKISGVQITGKKIILKDKKAKKALVNVKVVFKVYTGKKYKVFTVKTGSDGACGIYAGKLKAGVHKLIISSKEKNVKFNLQTKVRVDKIKINGAYCNIVLSMGKLRFV